MIVLGIGASHSDKDWPDAYWAEFIASLSRTTAGTIFLIGGAENVERAQMLIAQAHAPSMINACDLALTEAAALLRNADIFVGANSGPMNLAAATATDAFGLFGTTPVLSYSKYIHPIVPDGGPSPGGMQRILPAHVLTKVAPYLSQTGLADDRNAAVAYRRGLAAAGAGAGGGGGGVAASWDDIGSIGSEGLYPGFF